MQNGFVKESKPKSTSTSTSTSTRVKAKPNNCRHAFLISLRSAHAVSPLRRCLAANHIDSEHDLARRWRRRRRRRLLRLKSMPGATFCSCLAAEPKSSIAWPRSARSAVRKQTKCRLLLLLLLRLTEKLCKSFCHFLSHARNYAGTRGGFLKLKTTFSAAFAQRALQETQVKRVCLCGKFNDFFNATLRSHPACVAKEK